MLVFCGSSQRWSLVALHRNHIHRFPLFASQEVAAGKPKLSSSGDPHQLPVRPHKRFVQIYRESLWSYWSCFCCHVFLVHSSSKRKGSLPRNHPRGSWKNLHLWLSSGDPFNVSDQFVIKTCSPLQLFPYCWRKRWVGEMMELRAGVFGADTQWLVGGPTTALSNLNLEESGDKNSCLSPSPNPDASSTFLSDNSH